MLSALEEFAAILENAGGSKYTRFEEEYEEWQILQGSAIYSWGTPGKNFFKEIGIEMAFGGQKRYLKD